MCELCPQHGLEAMLERLSAASPVRTSALLASSLELAQALAQDCFSRLSGLPVSAGAHLSSWKTYPVSEVQNALFQTEEYGQPPELSLKPWPKAAICLDGYIFEQPMWERRTEERDGGALRQWLTPNVMDSLSPRSVEALKEYNERSRSGRTTVRNTPSSGNFRTRGGERADEMGLDNQVKCWPTPRAEDSQCAGAHGENVDSVNAAVLWNSARANDSEKRGDIAIDNRSGLPSDVKQWSTPNGDDANNVTRESGVFKSLTRDIQQWGTPRKDDAKDSGPPDSHMLDKGYLCAQVKTSGQQLSPCWEEILMGWPLNWTDASSPCSGIWPGWPMAQGPKQFDYEPPRTIAKGQISNRTKRVEMVGNGVVPQAAAMAFLILLEACHG